MSVQTEIDRISGNVIAALAAIAEKGVDVPDGSTSDALAELIAAIETGAAIPPWATEFETAQVTVTSTSKTLAVPCTMSAAPTNHIILAAVKPSASNTAAQEGEILYKYSTNYSGTLRETTAKGVLDINGTAIVINTNSSVAVGSWTLSDGIATLTSTNSKAYYADHTYNIIMWR